LKKVDRTFGPLWDLTERILTILLRQGFPKADKPDSWGMIVADHSVETVSEPDKGIGYEGQPSNIRISRVGSLE